MPRPAGAAGPQGVAAVGVRGVASVLIYVRDVAASADFYSRLLGVPAASRAGATAEFHAGSLHLVLHQDKAPGRAGVAGAMEADLEVDDAAAFRAALAARGIEAPEPRREPWGWTGFTVRDPDGTAVGFYQIPR